MSTQVTTGLQIRRSVQLTIDDQSVTVAEGETILSACRTMGTEIPTLCFGDTITPKNACRVCMVEVEGSRVLVPSCSRKVEPGMVVRTDTERTDHSRKLVLELLGSSVDLSLTKNVARWNSEYEAEPIPNASCATNVSMRVASSGKTHLLSVLRVVASIFASRPNSMLISLTQRASIAATAFRSAPLVHSCLRVSTTCARLAHGRKRSKRRPTPSAHTAVLAARSRCTYKTTRSSRSLRQAITR